MATNVVLPKCLADSPFTVCAACIYGKAIKRPHKTKTAISINEYKPAASVGYYVYIDWLVSSTPSLIAQISGFIMHQRYECEFVFVAHQYDFTYIHILNYKTGDEAVEVKKVFDAYLESHGVDIKYYYYDNENFRSSKCMKHCKDMHQGLTFSGVNAYCKNGQVDRCIRSLQDLSRCHMIDSHHWWTSSKWSNLYPYTICHADVIINETPCRCLHYTYKPTHIFSKSRSILIQGNVKNSSYLCIH